MTQVKQILSIAIIFSGCSQKHKTQHQDAVSEKIRPCGLVGPNEERAGYQQLLDDFIKLCGTPFSDDFLNQWYEFEEKHEENIRYFEKKFYRRISCLEDDDSHNLLYWAVISNNPIILHFTYQHCGKGVSFLEKDKKTQKSLLDIAIENKCYESIKFFHEVGCLFHMIDRRHAKLAVKSNHIDIIKLLYSNYPFLFNEGTLTFPAIGYAQSNEVCKIFLEANSTYDCLGSPMLKLLHGVDGDLLIKPSFDPSSNCYDFLSNLELARSSYRAVKWRNLNNYVEWVNSEFDYKQPSLLDFFHVAQIPCMQGIKPSELFDIFDAIVEKYKINLTEKIDGEYLTHLAIRAKNRTLIRYILSRGADPNAVDDNLHTALHLAVYWHRYSDLVESLVSSYGANVNVIDKQGWTPLLLALKNKDLQCVEFLLDKGADVQVGNAITGSPISLAISIGPRMDLRQLLDLGADIFPPYGNYVDSPFYLATQYFLKDNNFDYLDLLHQYIRSSVEEKKSYLSTHLLFLTKNLATIFGELSYSGVIGEMTKLIQWLLKLGADRNATDENGWTPLLHAIKNQVFYISRQLAYCGGTIALPVNIPLDNTLLTDIKDVVDFAKKDNKIAVIDEIVKGKPVQVNERLSIPPYTEHNTSIPQLDQPRKALCEIRIKEDMVETSHNAPYFIMQAISSRTPKNTLNTNPVLPNLESNFNVALQCFYSLFGSTLQPMINQYKNNSPLANIFNQMRQRNTDKVEQAVQLIKTFRIGELNQDVNNLIFGQNGIVSYCTQMMPNFRENFLIDDVRNKPTNNKQLLEISIPIVSNDIDLLEILHVLCDAYSRNRRIRFCNGPKILTIHLDRFKFVKGYPMKNNRKVRFPETFSVLQNWFLEPNKAPKVEYSLAGVIIHKGSLLDGHYWCYCKNKQEKWFRYDDAQVSGPLEFYILENEALGNQYDDASAYILFYEQSLFIPAPKK